MTVKNFSARDTQSAQKGIQHMARTHSGEELLGFTPFLKGSDALSDKIVKTRFPFYQATLFAHDLIAVMVAFGFSVWVNGVVPFLFKNSITSVSLLILVLLVIQFFPTYNF